MTQAGEPSRAAALALLRAVFDQRQALDDVFDREVDPFRLEPRDRGLARALAAMTLRRLGQIDAAIDHALDRPLAKAALPARDLMRLGAAQLLFMNTPAHAAVSTTVALATGPAVHYRSLVNAVLRRLAREGGGIVAAQDAARLNTPDWLFKAWGNFYGEATARAIAEAHLHEAPLDFSVKDDAAGWAEKLTGTVLPTGSVRRPAGGAVEELPGFAEGAWWIQDTAATLPARLLGDVRGKRVFDLCAAPGGKTAQLAAMGARVTAVDRSAARLARVGANLARLKLEAELVAADATQWRPDDPADAILLDAPCSATGTIRRHPDIPHLKRANDVAKLAVVQKKMLQHAATLLKPGGTLVYCTCSLQPEEGEMQLAGVPLTPAPVDPDTPGVPAEAIARRGWLRTLPSFWPERGGMDGFFAARWTKPV